MEKKFVSLELKADDEGVVEGYGSTFGNVDQYNDTVVKGAFSQSLMGRKPKMLWQHRMDQPIGVWDEIREDDKGLYMKGRLALATTKGREAYELVKMGAMEGLSIGYRTLKDEMQGAIRRLMQVELYEVSFVTEPADKFATLTAVKAGTIRDWEAFLRDEGGLSHREAKAFVANGFKSLAALRDEASDDSKLSGDVLELLKTFGR